MDNRAEEYVRKMKSPRMVQNFRRMAGQAILSQGGHNSRHEAQQIRAFRQAEADAAIKTALDDAAANWQSDAAYDEALDTAMAALELKTRGFGDAARKAAVAELDSGFAAARLSAMVQADPMAAEAWYKEHKGSFTAAARAKAEEVLERETRAFKVQAAVDDLTRKFGPDSESKGLAWIRKNYGGEDEDRIAAAFKTRIAEMEANRAHGEAQRHKQQAANFEALYKEFWAHDVNPPRETLDKLLGEGRISSAQHRQGVGWILASGSRAGAEKTLQRRMGEEWRSLSVPDRERAIMRELGTTEEERAALLPVLAVMAAEGTVSDADIDDYWRNGKLTDAERAWYKGLDKKFSAEQKAFVTRQNKEIENDIGKIFGPGYGSQSGYKGAPLGKANAKAIFAGKVAELDEKSRTYREDVLKARKEAVIEAVEESGYALTKSRYLGMGGAYTPIGKRSVQALGAIDDAIEGAEEYRPEVYDSIEAQGGADELLGIVADALSADVR
jgi:hypothetical protein